MCKDEGRNICQGADKSVEVLNISSMTWREGPPLPADHYGGQAVVYDSVLYVLYRDGKRRESGKMLQALEVFGLGQCFQHLW